MGDVGKPERIVEDEPIGFPDEEPLTAPGPVPTLPAPVEPAGPAEPARPLEPAEPVTAPAAPV
ncbi:hypothetical protein CC117_08905 [Parafrankia colletiae]|uniref:Uncharacterized protein n=1 Tax=Parafrankia colletiae TaxID=573497 RepID=A0A1S1RJC3_9ACTN|nr:hypothetical protein [Parafrankia colletiae]MCK9901710.1 hypothetical protein [Frankia sp. Cpl3]OHV45881.1 hypothetical protein CC117_08905 [Parafrankia colletiae]